MPPPPPRRTRRARPGSAPLPALFGCAASLGLVLARGAQAAPAPADLVVRDGQVLTVDARDSRAQAVAIRDGRFVAVGSEDEIAPYIGPSTRVIDAGGRTVIPGIFESHVHPNSVVRGDIEHPFRQLSSIAEIQGYIRERLKDTPPGTWIQVPRVDVTRIRERRLPNREEMDAAAGNRPAIFTWQYANRVVQILDSAALRIANIGPNTEPFPGGKIDHGPDGQPTGRMENCSGLVAMFLHARGSSEQEIQDGLVRLFHTYNRIGITSITDRLTDLKTFRTYQLLESQGRLPVRVTVTFALVSDGSVASTEKFIDSIPFKTGYGDDWVRAGPLKIAVDGGSLYGTAYLREPYGPRALALYGLTDPTYRGDLRISPGKIDNLIRTGNHLGWQMASHVTGDAGVDAVLDAVEAANADSPPIGPRRYNLIHAYFPDAATAARAARLGVVVDTQPAYYYKDADALADALGIDRVSRYIGVGTWVRAGVTVVLNSDHMLGYDPDTSVNPYNPFLTMQTAVTRKTEGGNVYGADQKVSREQALRMMTINPAYMNFDENRKGSIEVGKLADLAVLTGDFLGCPEDHIRDLRASHTIIGGKVVYERP